MTESSKVDLVDLRRHRKAPQFGQAGSMAVRYGKIMDENGLRRVRLYDARASCLTYVANNGVPDHLLAMWAGHTNVKTTKKWYVKPDVADLLPAAEAWGGLAGHV
ncbi:site-specific integrase [Streptomyces coeruleorubidus]|uniref:hypothetical protein n=1 Tax=Streptomyces coeruleorubidus TaxID=116188 RepID=UPI00368422A8